MSRRRGWSSLSLIGAPVAILFAVAGVGALGLAVFLERPAMLRFSRDGRLVTGQISRSAPSEARNGDKRRRNQSQISVDDPALGRQTIDVYGDFAVGQPIPVICATAAGRCLSADDLRSRIDMWPFTPLMLAGAISIALAATSGLTALLRRHRGAP
jgi:hypothetical protein